MARRRGEAVAGAACVTAAVPWQRSGEGKTERERGESERRWASQGEGEAGVAVGEGEDSRHPGAATLSS